MNRCSFCGHRHHEDALRAFRPACADGDPRPEQPGGSVYACAPCDRKRERFIRQLAANRANWARLQAVA